MAFAVIISFASNGQDFKKFKVGLGFGYAIPGDGGGGIALYIEPMYRIKDNIGIGFRYESAATVPANVLSGGVTITPSAAVIGSFGLTGQYYFSNNKFRPFAGFGIASFTLASIDVAITGSGSVGGVLSPSVSKVGFYPRVGFDYGHFNMTLDYNFIPAETATSLVAARNASYIGIKLGFSFGGGTK